MLLDSGGAGGHRDSAGLLNLGLVMATPVPRAEAGAPCCSISSIADNDLVTARDIATKRVFQFQVDGKARLAYLCSQK